MDTGCDFPSLLHCQPVPAQRKYTRSVSFRAFRIPADPLNVRPSRAFLSTSEPHIKRRESTYSKVAWFSRLTLALIKLPTTLVLQTQVSHTPSMACENPLVIQVWVYRTQVLYTQVKTDVLVIHTLANSNLLGL